MEYKVIWLKEFHVDYSHFPAIDWMAKENAGKGIAPNPTYDLTDKQMRAYELWRRRQDNVYHLSVYQSHFADFAKYPHNLPTDFFDFQVNIFERRHQAFIENRSKQPIILLASTVLIGEDFNVEQYIQLAEEKKQLVNVCTPGAEAHNLSGLWVIPTNVQEQFCMPIPKADKVRHCANDLGYWLSCAATSTISVEDVNLSNDSLALFGEVLAAVEAEVPFANALTKHHYPAWTTDDFRTWINKQTFRLARTMRWCPHEYIFMWDRTLDDQMDYIMAIDYLHRNAVIDEFQHRFKLATYVDGHKYWYVGVIDLLNRTSMELQRRIFAEDGKDERGRKIQQTLFNT